MPSKNSLVDKSAEHWPRNLYAAIEQGAKFSNGYSSFGINILQCCKFVLV